MKRATASDIVAAKIHVISIHALMKRATLGSNSFGDIQKDFNPRPHEEGDN